MPATAVLLQIVLVSVPLSAREEILFRGPVQYLANVRMPGRLQVGSLSLRHGTLAIVLGFALVHLVAGGGAPAGFDLQTWRYLQTGMGGLTGIIFGYVRDETGAVWVPAFLHSLANASLVILFHLWPL